MNSSYTESVSEIVELGQMLELSCWQLVPLANFLSYVQPSWNIAYALLSVAVCSREGDDAPKQLALPCGYSILLELPLTTIFSRS